MDQTVRRVLEEPEIVARVVVAAVGRHGRESRVDTKCPRDATQNDSPSA